jgi:hypothetical protein
LHFPAKKHTLLVEIKNGNNIRLKVLKYYFISLSPWCQKSGYKRVSDLAKVFFDPRNFVQPAGDSRADQRRYKELGRQSEPNHAALATSLPRKR